MGSEVADADIETNFSADAQGDDKTGKGTVQEEDAWPKDLTLMKLSPGTSFTAEIPYVSVKNGANIVNGYVRGWIDFNGNGRFDEGEGSGVVHTKSLRGTARLIWQVPIDLKNQERSYVRLRYGYTADEIKLPIGMVEGGEVEDHVIKIVKVDAPWNCEIPAGKFSTSAFATGGEGKYLNDILWMTWGAESSADKYGKNNVVLPVGSETYANIIDKAGVSLRVKATIVGIEEIEKTGSEPVGEIRSYATGGWKEDFLDNAYNIGGKETLNTLVYGIKATRKKVKIRVRLESCLNGRPSDLQGIVVADAETGNANESIGATGTGTWHIIEAYTNTNKAAINISKITNGKYATYQAASTGSNSGQGAIAYLKFDRDYDQEVELELYSRNGSEAMAIGVIPAQLDMGDAPQVYGDAYHLISPKTPVGTDTYDESNGKEKNINALNIYKVYTLEHKSGHYLGSTLPDGEIVSSYAEEGAEATGDDLKGIAGEKEEDFWKKDNRRINIGAFTGDQGYRMTSDVFVDENLPSWQENKKVYVAGWIDFNQDGKFDPSERSEMVTLTNGGKQTVDLVWKGKKNIKSRYTYARVRMSSKENTEIFGTYNEGGVQDATGFSLDGEVEDYRLYIVGPGMVNPVLRQVGK